MSIVAATNTHSVHTVIVIKPSKSRHCDRICNDQYKVYWNFRGKRKINFIFLNGKQKYYFFHRMYVQQTFRPFSLCPIFKVQCSPHLTFVNVMFFVIWLSYVKFSNKLPPFKISPNLVPKSSTPQTNLNVVCTVFHLIWETITVKWGYIIFF